MLFISIKATLCAQSNLSDKTFQVPENIVFNRRFMIALDKGNKVQIEVSDITDLDRVANIDSLLQVYLTDIAALKDSLADPLTSKRIDYITDAQGRKKIRFQQFYPKGASFLLNKNELASLRTEQDTISIIGIIVNPPTPKDKISLRNPRYYHFTFYLNNQAELITYMKGILSAKIATIQANVTGRWPIVLGSGSHYLQKDKTITADRPKGFTSNRTGDFIAFNFSVNMQNYKNYFTPSFSLGTNIILTNRDRTFKWQPGLFWEPHFFFARDPQNKLHTYRNDFLTFTYAQGGTRDYDPRKDFAFSAVLSLGYMVHRQGDYFDKSSFRLGGGKIMLSKTALEPCLYFNNFFRGVTPGLRISQFF